MSHADGGGLRLRLDPEVLVITRANLIGHAAREIARPVGVRPGALETIHDGFKTSILKKVDILISRRDHADDVVGHLEIVCDWERHVLLLTSGNAITEFKIRADQPLPGQISQLMERVVAFMKAKVDEFGPVAASASYVTRSDRDSTEFDLKHKLVALNDDDRRRLRKARLDKELSVTDSVLEELGITFRWKSSSDEEPSDGDR